MWRRSFKIIQKV